MKGKKRPASERAKALGIAAVDGVAAASEQTGIPESTIYQWQDSPEFVELRNRTKEAVVDEWWGIVQQGFRKTAELLGGTTDAQKAATATAIIADKMLLVRGDATSRIENVSLTDGLSADTKRELRDRLARSVLGELDGTGAVGVVGGVEVGVDS